MDGLRWLLLLFGLLVIAILKPLKRLTHGVEEAERKMDD